MIEIVHCKNYEEMSIKAAGLIAKISVEQRHSTLALSGGTSVKRMLEILAANRIEWKNTDVFMADERWVERNGKESNFRQADELFFSKAQGIRAHPFDISAGVDAYSNEFFSSCKGTPDIAVLGVGEDCHIASLFPNHPALKSGEEGYIVAENSPKPPPKRVTLSPETISKAKNAILLFASQGKRGAFDNFVNPKISVSNCPAKIALKAKRAFVYTVFGDGNAK